MAIRSDVDQRIYQTLTHCFMLIYNKNHLEADSLRSRLLLLLSRFDSVHARSIHNNEHFTVKCTKEDHLLRIRFKIDRLNAIFSFYI